MSNDTLPGHARFCTCTECSPNGIYAAPSAAELARGPLADVRRATRSPELQQAIDANNKVADEHYHQRGKCLKCGRPGPLKEAGTLVITVTRYLDEKSARFLVSYGGSSACTARICSSCAPVLEDGLRELGLEVP